MAITNLLAAYPDVLILMVVDEGLVHWYCNCRQCIKCVLILVVVDNGLVPQPSWLRENA